MSKFGENGRRQLYTDGSILKFRSMSGKFGQKKFPGVGNE
jgi:hypothetical protein